MGPNQTSRSDASIALEGAGLLGICLSKALTTVQQSSDMNQIDSPMEPLARNWRLTVLEPSFSDIERIKDAFGNAVLTSQKGEINLDLHANLVGLSNHYNRVGQNWRLLGNKFVLKERRKGGIAGAEITGTDVYREAASDHNGKFVHLEETQVLAYGDKL